MDIVSQRKVQDGAETLRRFSIYCNSTEYNWIIECFKALLVPSSTASIEEARQILLSEMPERVLAQMRNMLDQMVRAL